MKKVKRLITMLMVVSLVCTSWGPTYAAEVTEQSEQKVAEQECSTEVLGESTSVQEETELATEEIVVKEIQSGEDIEASESNNEKETEEGEDFDEQKIEEEDATALELVEDEIELLGATTSMKLYAIYLGGNPGDAVLLESDGEYILMDLGDSTAGKTSGSYASVKALLDSLGVTKLSLYYSHFHGDHTGGVGTDGALDWLTSEYNVTTIYAPDTSIYLGKIDYSDIYEKIERISAKNNENTEVKYLKVGSTFTVGGASFEIIGPVGVDGYTDPGEPTEDTSLDADGTYDDFVNNCSLVARVTCGNTVYLTAGDAKSEAESALIKKYKNTGKLDADIYKLSHHGIAPANSTEILSYITPICSFGLNGGYTGTEEYGDNGKIRRMTYSSKQNAGAYGLCYMVADEKDTLIVDINNNAIKMYRSKNPTTQLKGIVKTVGSYGTSYSGKNYDFEFYDYYYLGADSKPITGIQSVDFDGDGTKEKHYFESGGRMYTGAWGWDDSNNFVYKPWRQEGSNWQYYDQKTAVMATGWKTISGNKYYFDKSTGYRKSGICEIDGKKYFFKESGILYVNRWVNIDGKKRYVDKNGVILTGFQTIDGGLYYLDPDNDGIAVTGGTDWPIKKIGKKYYAIKDTGLIYTGGWKKYTSGSTKNFRYFNSKGEMQTGWFTDSDGTYYLITSGKSRGLRTTGIATIDSVVYNFGTSGKMITKSWYNDSKSGKDKNHWMYFGKDGKQTTGWKTIDGEKYYFDPSTGYRSVGLTKISSKYYYFTDGGKMQKSKTVTVDGYKCKLDKNGVWTNLPKPDATKISKVTTKSKQATVTWNKKSGSGYSVYMSTSKNGTYEKIKNVSSSKTTSYTKKDLKGNKTYYFKVRTYVEVGGYKFYSSYSSPKSVKVKK